MIATRRASFTRMIYAALAIIGGFAFALVMLSFLVPACLSIIPAFGESSGVGRLAMDRIFAAFRFTLTEAFL